MMRQKETNGRSGSAADSQKKNRSKKEKQAAREIASGNGVGTIDGRPAVT